MIGHVRQLLDYFNNAVDIIFRGPALFEKLVMKKTSADFMNQFDQKDPPGIRPSLFFLVGPGNVADYTEGVSLFYTPKLLKQLFGFFVQ